MTAQRHEPPWPHVERTFTGVRAALPAESVSAFDAEFSRITGAPVVDLAALDEFLAGWHRIASRYVADPEDWARMYQVGAEIEAGTRPPGQPLADVLRRRAQALGRQDFSL
jgi:hypothetical protein